MGRPKLNRQIKGCAAKIDVELMNSVKKLVSIFKNQLGIKNNENQIINQALLFYKARLEDKYEKAIEQMKQKQMNTQVKLINSIENSQELAIETNKQK